MGTSTTMNIMDDNNVNIRVDINMPCHWWWIVYVVDGRENQQSGKKDNLDDERLDRLPFGSERSSDKGIETRTDPKYEFTTRHLEDGL